MIFLGCALWKDAKTAACFSGSDQHKFFWLMEILLLSDLISLNAYILHPWVGPILFLLDESYFCWFPKEKVWGLFLSHMTVGVWRRERRCPVHRNPKHAFSLGSACTQEALLPQFLVAFADCGYCHDLSSHTFPFHSTVYEWHWEGSSGRCTKSETESLLSNLSFPLLIKSQGWFFLMGQQIRIQTRTYLVVETDNC